MKTSSTIARLAQRIPTNKSNLFDVTTESVQYRGNSLIGFLSESESNKTLRQVLLLSNISSAFDIEEGDTLKI